MARKYDPLINAYAKWLFPLIDRYNWGYYHAQKKCPMRWVTNLALGNCITYKAFGDACFPITRTHLENHQTYFESYYYQSNGKSGKALICLDIDNPKDGRENDAMALAQYITNRFHRKCYIEPSTHGKGAHIYLLFDLDGMSTWEFEKLLPEYKKALQAILKTKNFNSRFDRPCGNFTLVSRRVLQNKVRYHIEDGDRGILGKIPRLVNGWPDLRRLMGAPIQKLKSIYRVIKEAYRIQKPPEHTEEHTSVSYLLTKVPKKVSRNLASVRAIPDAFERMHHACHFFVTVYRRLPYDEYELCRYYESESLNHRAERHPERLRRARNVIAHQKEQFSIESLDRLGYNKDYYLELIRKHVTNDCWEDVWSADRRITEEDLAIVLYTMDSNILSASPKNEWMFTCGNQCISDMFEALKAAGVTTRGGKSMNKIVACKNVLINAGLIECVEETWKFAGPYKGICKKFGLGINHPRYAEYVKIRDSFESQAEEEVQVPVAAMPITYDIPFDDETEHPWIVFEDNEESGEVVKTLEISPDG